MPFIVVVVDEFADMMMQVGTLPKKRVQPVST